MAEGVGFEPTRPFWGLTVFKTAGFNRSPTPPAPLILASSVGVIGDDLERGLDKAEDAALRLRPATRMADSTATETGYALYV